MALDSRTEQLAQAAMQRTRAGDAAGAEQLWRQVRTTAPDHPMALFYLGRQLLFRKDAQGALEFLKRAAVVTPKEPSVHLNLAYAYQALENPDEEMKSLDAALSGDPFFVPAILMKGALLERQGKQRQAAKIYRDALTALPPTAQLPNELIEQAAHARETVRQDAAELAEYIESSLAPVRSLHGNVQLDRFEECKDAYIGTKRIYVAKPVLLNFPHLPAITFFENEQFPWLEQVLAGTDAMREELLSMVREEREEFRPYVNHPDGIPPNQWVELNHSRRWSALFLWENGKRNDEHCARCPRTAAILENAPLCDALGFAPTGFFSALEPHTRIPPHTGTTNARLTVHIPLVIPEKCGFRVGNDVREWELGNALIFDDTIEHEAWNDSDELRAILIFDIWNPYLSHAECDHVAALLAGVRTYYGEQ
jgi:aspartyl/asparaginyl beta-hydroxylase (cupin superfamily)